MMDRVCPSNSLHVILNQRPACCRLQGRRKRGAKSDAIETKYTTAATGAMSAPIQKNRPEIVPRRSTPSTRPAAFSLDGRCSSKRRRRQSSSLPEGFVEGVAGAANGADRIAFPAARERLAQPPDVNVDGAFVDLRRLPPNRIEQLGAREHPAGLFEQIFEEPELRRAEVDVARAAANPPGLPIKIEIAGKKAFGNPLRPASSQKRPDPRHELGHRERLDDIVV